MGKNEILTFALGKGRLAKETVKLLQKAGISCEQVMDEASRKLVFVNEDEKVRFFFGKSTRCSHLCRIWCCRYWCGGEGYHSGGKQKGL